MINCEKCTGFFAEVLLAGLNVRCIYASEDDIAAKSVEVGAFYDALQPLKGIKSAQSIQKVNNMCVNMYLNTGD